MGGRRGRLIKQEDRRTAVVLIDEAVNAQARLYKACEAIGISTKTYNRWNKMKLIDQRKGASKKIPRKLSEEEKDEIETIACSHRYVDCNPYEIVASLLDEGVYIASVRTFYRVLKERSLIKHRRKDRVARNISKPPELKATGPGQVYSWDITWLKSEINGKYYYAYVVMDIWSRLIVAWEVHDRESQELSKDMFNNLNSRLDLKGAKLHADNGHPMKGSTILSTLISLGVAPSFSRPRTSDDNAFSEALFKTLKYRVNYPDFFDGIDKAREWAAYFVDWYNTKHKHSGIGMITPEQRHNGQGDKIMNKRNSVMEKAYLTQPERWSNGVKKWTNIKTVYLNPADQKTVSVKIAV